VWWAGSDAARLFAWRRFCFGLRGVFVTAVRETWGGHMYFENLLLSPCVSRPVSPLVKGVCLVLLGEVLRRLFYIATWRRALCGVVRFARFCIEPHADLAATSEGPCPAGPWLRRPMRLLGHNGLKFTLYLAGKSHWAIGAAEFHLCAPGVPRRRHSSPVGERGLQRLPNLDRHGFEADGAQRGASV